MRAEAFFLARLFALLVLLALQACGKTEDPLLLPGFERARPDLRRISLEAAGQRPVLTLERVDGHWQAREYRGWPVADDRVQGLLDALAQARIVERKTRRPELYPRLGVEDVAAGDASGLRLSWQGKDGEVALIVGKPGPAGRGQFLRQEGSDQALLVDRSLLVERQPLAWLDRQLLDLSSSRIREVRVEPSGGKAFVIRMNASGHALADVAAVHSDASACAALAGALEHLEFEDIESDSMVAMPRAGSAGATASVQGSMVAKDGDADPSPAHPSVADSGMDGSDAAGSSTVDFSTEFLAVDGRRVLVRGWRREARYWITLSPDLDEAIAREWLAQAGATDGEAKLQALRRETELLRARLQGRRFLLGIERTAPLVRRRPQYLRSS